MDSILDKILTQRHAEEIRGFDPISMVGVLLHELPEREREVVTRRFGLPVSGECPVETLEEIGTRLEVTRERVRQITKTSITHLQTIAGRHEEVQRFVRVAEHLLQSYGGALEEQFFIEQLLDFAVIAKTNPQWNHAADCLRFLLDYIVSDSITHQSSFGSLKALYRVQGANTDSIETVAKVLVEVIVGAAQPLPGDELLQKFQQTDVYQTKRDTLITEPVRVARDFYGSGVAAEAPTEAKEELRVLLGYASAAAELERNIYQEWGLRSWPTIRPRRMNDKIYLILRHEHEPLHFTEITRRINDSQFDKKVAKAPSVHNELILDKRFVLVGRGLYALKEWGYEPGTVADVIAELLRSRGALTRDQIVAQVLEQRQVKKQTIHLALMNRERFLKQADGRYTLIVVNP